MKILPFKLKRLYDGKWIFVSQYFRYSDFGISRIGEHNFHVSQYIPSKTPGTGFYAHISESSSYQHFCRTRQKLTKQSYWRLLTGQDFSFSREIKLVEQALASTSDSMRKRMFETYRNCLFLAREAEEVERIVIALRKKIHNHHSHRYSHALKHYKHRMLSLEHEIDNIRFNLKEYCDDELLKRYSTMAQAFGEMTHCRRVWDLTTPGKHGQKHAQVFFDMANFNYILSSCYLPLMRDAQGNEFYILPDVLLKVRSSVDFESIPLKDLSILFHPVGDGVQSEFNIPELGLSFRFSSTDRVTKFVEAARTLGMK